MIQKVNYLFRRIFRRLQLLTGKRVLHKGGACHMCGSCCRNISLLHSGHWISSEREFKTLCKQDPRFERFKIIGDCDEGWLVFTCTWLTSENRCKDHENRMDFCRNYPTTDIWVHGGYVNNSCGYMLKAVRPFSGVLKDEERKLKGG